MSTVGLNYVLRNSERHWKARNKTMKICSTNPIQRPAFKPPAYYRKPCTLQNGSGLSDSEALWRVRPVTKQRTLRGSSNDHVPDRGRAARARHCSPVPVAGLHATTMKLLGLLALSELPRHLVFLQGQLVASERREELGGAPPVWHECNLRYEEQQRLMVLGWFQAKGKGLEMRLLLSVKCLKYFQYSVSVAG